MTDDFKAENKNTIEALEQREAQAMLSADMSTLQALWADDLIVNSTVNIIAGKQLLLEMVEDGRLRLRMYERRPVRVVVLDDVTVTTGNEVSELIVRNVAVKHVVSYMNVWGRRGGTWRLIARHVGLIQREEPKPL